MSSIDASFLQCATHGSNQTSPECKDAEYNFFSKFGKPHGAYQQYDCAAKNTTELLTNILPDKNNPIKGWCDNMALINEKDSHTWYPSDQRAAFYIPTNRSNTETNETNNKDGESYNVLSYENIHNLISNVTSFSSHRQTMLSHNPNDNSDSPMGVIIVAVLLPSCLMTDTALAILSIMADLNAVAAPLEPDMTPNEVAKAIAQMNCEAILTTRELWDKISPTFENEEFRGQLNDIRLVEEFRSVQEGIRWSSIGLKQNKCMTRNNNLNNDETMPKLLLRTSGTTSQPKVVPITGSAMLYNGISLASGLGLRRTDCKLNALPFYHIGGWNSFMAVLVSGSSIIMSGPFNPERFMTQIRNLIPIKNSDVSPKVEDKIGMLLRRSLTLINTIALNEEENNTDETGAGEKSFSSVTDAIIKETKISPTWYSGNPTINQALVLAIKKELRDTEATTFPNHLRFARSGAAHLSYDTALNLSKLLGIPILPAYGMSECRPVSLSSKNHIFWNSTKKCTEGTPETVGVPIGPSIKVLDEHGSPIVFGSENIGEICVGGPGVIKKYWGIDEKESHTPDGYLRTGDYGFLDSTGQLYLKGRKKELIKRGGEQVWPNDIDDVVETLEFVRKGVGFGVKNDLWGEEVAVAVVMKNDHIVNEEEKDIIRKDVIQACRENLKPAAVPVQVIILNKMNDLPIGPTGKVQRNKMSEHLKIKAKDHLLQNVLTSDQGCIETFSEVEAEVEKSNMDETKVQLPTALNGIRFIAACFVLKKHVGSYPSGPWEMVSQFYQAPAIFLALGVFQHTVAAESNILKMWVLFVGNKIGTMHSLFIATQFVALASYLTLQCGDNGYQETILESSCTNGSFLRKTLLNLSGSTLLTPFFPYNVVNYYAWFQSCFYTFIIIFPLAHTLLHKLSFFWQNFVLSITLVSTATIGPSLHFLGLWYHFDQTVIAWAPLLLASMLLSYRFIRKSSDVGSIESIYSGFMADFFGIFLLVLAIVSATSQGCVFTPRRIYDECMKNNENHLPTEFFIADEEFVFACGLDFADFQQIEDEVYGGRFITKLNFIMSELRVATPVILLWLYFLSFGKGITIRIFRLKFLLLAAPWAYHLYLLQLPVLRFYWLITRGIGHKRWSPFNVNAPILWYELPIIIVTSVAFGAILQKTIVEYLLPHTSKLGVKVCTLIKKIWIFLFGCMSCANGRSLETDGRKKKRKTPRETITDLLTILSGVKVSDETKLADLNLHSLGATAFLGIVRASIPSAKKLSFVEFSKMENVKDLVHHLDITCHHDDNDFFVDDLDEGEMHDIDLEANSSSRVDNHPSQ